MDRYKDTVEFIKHNGKRRYESMYYPKFEYKSTDIYFISKQFDRMDLLAQEYYNDPTLWWVIQRANNLAGGTLQIQPGLQIRVPFPLDAFTTQNKLIETQF